MHGEDEDENHAGLDENCDYDRLQEGIVVARLMITIMMVVLRRVASI